MAKQKMSEKKAEIAQEKTEEKKTPHLDKWVSDAIIKMVGRPPMLYSVKSCNVYDNRWRVNIWCEKYTDLGASTYYIKHSYFVHFDKDKGITFSNPPINKLYD